MADPFLPDHIDQVNFQTPATGEGKLCWAASGAMAVRFAKSQRTAPNPIEFRKAANKPKGSIGNISDVRKGCLAFGVDLQVHEEMPWEEAVHRLDGHPYTSLVIMIDYDKIPNKKSCDRNWDDYHVIWVPGGHVGPPGPGGGRMTLYDDPLCPSRDHIQLYWIRDAAKWYAKQNHKAADTIVCGQVFQPHDA